ncbi:MAG: right-handed parallel beta-helix repeat-containing protein, partial [Prevotellaceae bacterium]|nr:right-handed parallel beta-helix repeat-containing protein [Prevotellaceae bacterium]
MTRFFFLLPILLISLPLRAADIYVSPRGSDAHSGLQAQPMATLQAALRKARELRRTSDTTAANGIRIVMADGEYLLDEPVCLRPEDGGRLQSPTTIEAAPNARPVLSGGIRLGQWRLAPRTASLPKSAQGKVWMADAPLANGRTFGFRQLWVNGRKAQRAQQ